MSTQTVPSAEQQRFREAVEIANVPTLIPVLVQLTGDQRWLGEPYRPERNRGLDDNPTGGLPQAVQDEIREAALNAILAWRAGTPVALERPSDEQLVRMLSVSMGEEVPLEYGPLIAAELGIDKHPLTRRRAPANADFNVLIVGAGASGIAAAVKLEDAGIPYTMVEKHDAVGGTWLENRYPGCGVDTPSALYSFSFAPQDWSKYFALRDELKAYFEHVADERGLNDHIRFSTEAVSAAFEADTQRWAVELRGPDGSQQTVTANVLITAVGAFRKPKMPGVPGLERFEGPVAHTAEWPEDLDLRGRRVAVIGNGASAMQLVPAVADEVSELVVFQREPQWAAPFDLFHVDVPEPVRFLGREVPLYRAWYRVRNGWTFNDRIHAALQRDPEWPHPERSMNKINDAHRRFFVRYIEQQLGDRTDLLDTVVPKYPPYGKRILLDNGWYRTMTREHVRLVSEPIAEVTPSGIRTASGEAFEVDVIACATGFDVVRFLGSIEVRGSDGQTLREVWEDDNARAYLGTAVPGFPNLFMVYGPNTQAGHGGSLLGMTESQLDYIVDLLGQMIDQGIGAAEVRSEVYEDYNARIDRAHANMVWSHPGMSTYYRNSRGRVVVNTPWRIVDYWNMTRAADLDDYVVAPAVGSRAAA